MVLRNDFFGVLRRSCLPRAPAARKITDPEQGEALATSKKGERPLKDPVISLFSPLNARILLAWDEDQQQVPAH